MTTPTKSFWRVDITALRAIAVLPVLLFHAFPSLIPGGFVGVDVFFVISGYLISGILFRELRKTGKIDFWLFYQKRIRRILPNLFLVLLFVGVIGWLFYTNRELSFLARNIAYSAVFAENIFLIKNAQDYFALSSEINPLLHVWSLAIEEQFYIVFPVFSLVLWKIAEKFSSKLFHWGLIIMFAASLAYCLWMSLSTSSKETLYYLPFVRFWELGAGCLLAYYESFEGWTSSRYSESSRNLLSWLSAFLLLFSFVFIDSAKVTFPGIATLIPILGTICFIASGADASFNKIISQPVIIFIGLISYSLYLWHWPILVFSRVLFENTTNNVILALAITLIVSSLVYKYVENPIRNNKSGGVSVILLTLLVVFYSSGRLINIHSDSLPRVSSTFNEYIQKRDMDIKFPGDELVKVRRDGVEYYTNNPNESPVILFIGDCHLQHLTPRFDEANRKNIPYGVISELGCFVAPGVRSTKSMECNKSIESYLRLVKNEKIKKVVQSQRWAIYIDEQIAESDAESQFVNVQGNSVSLRQAGFEIAMLSQKQLLEDLKKEYVIILDNPWEDGVDKILPLEGRLEYLRNFDGKLSPVPLPERDQWKQGNDAVVKIVGESARYIELESTICPQGMCNLDFYWDDDRLRASTVRARLTVVDQVFDGL